MAVELGERWMALEVVADVRYDFVVRLGMVDVGAVEVTVNR